MKPAVLLITSFVLACSNAKTDDTEKEDAGTPDPGTPLLEQKGNINYNCTIAGSMICLENSWGGGDYVSSGDIDLIPEVDGGAYLVRIENNEQGASPERRMLGALLKADGTLEPPTILYSESAQSAYFTDIAAARDNDGYVVIWSRREDSKSPELELVRIDASKEIVGTPNGFASSGPYQQETVLIETETGHAAIWLDKEIGVSKLMFALFDGDGKLIQAAKPLAQETSMDIGGLISFGDGFALTYSVTDSYETGANGFLMLLDADGNPIGNPTALEGSSQSFFNSSMSKGLIARDDELLVAWSVTEKSSEDKAATIVQVARFDADGALVSPVYQLQAPVIDRESVHPTWVDLEEDIGLLWSEGTIIYVCAGCFPDNELKFVVLDGDTLTPRSQVVTLANTTSEGGLMEPTAAKVGNSIVIAATAQYHVWAEGATGAVTCTH